MIQAIMNKDKSDDKKISAALMASFVILTIQYFILIYFNLLETENASKVQLISKVLVGLVFLYALPVVIKRSKLKLIGSYSVSVFVFLLHYLMFPENSLYMRELTFPFFFMCLPVLVYSMSIQNWNILKLYMKKASFIVFLFGAILGGLVFAGKVTIGTYSMSLSYYMLLPMLIYLDELFDQPSLKACLFSLVALLIILALGSRGAILCMAIFIFLKMVKSLSKLTYTKLLLNLTFFAAIIVTFIYLDSILQYINNLLLNFGINSRTIALFLMDSVHLSGRDSIYQKIIEAILNNPLLGIGVAGDRLIMGGGYTHNLILEVLANFGVIIGSSLLIVLLLLIVRNLLTKDNETYNMIIIWLSLGFVPLMVSGSYLMDMNFWILIGLMINSIFQKNKIH